jgi:hypothetical protein
MYYDFPNQLSGYIKRYHIDGINIDVEGDVDLCGFTGISNDARPGSAIQSKYEYQKYYCIKGTNK